MSFVPSSNPPNNIGVEKSFGPVTQLPVKVLPDSLKNDIIARANMVSQRSQSQQDPKFGVAPQQISQERPPFSTMSTDQGVFDNAPVFIPVSGAPPTINLTKQNAPQQSRDQIPNTGIYPNQSYPQNQTNMVQGQQIGQPQNLGQGQAQSQYNTMLGNAPFPPNPNNQGNNQSGTPYNPQYNPNANYPPTTQPPQIPPPPNTTNQRAINPPYNPSGPNYNYNPAPGGQQGLQQPYPGFPSNMVGSNNNQGNNQSGTPYNPQYNPNANRTMAPNFGPNPGLSYPPNNLPPNQGFGFPQPPPQFYGGGGGGAIQQPFGVPPPLPLLPHQLPGFLPTQLGYGFGGPPNMVYCQAFQTYVPVHLQDRMLQANMAFDMFDTNRNGSISFREWKHMLEYLGYSCTHHQARHLFHMVDANRSGGITRWEFCNWWASFEPASFSFPSVLMYI